MCHFVTVWGQFAMEHSSRSGGGAFFHEMEAVCHGPQQKWGGAFCHCTGAVCLENQQKWGGGGAFCN